MTMLTKEKLNKIKRYVLGEYIITRDYKKIDVFDIVESHLKLYAKLEKAEVEIAEMKESHALQIGAVIKCNKELAKLKRLVEGEDERI